MNLTHFKAYTKQDISAGTKVRRFETRLGERVHVLTDPKEAAGSLKTITAKYVVFGIQEDIGVLANGGTGGTGTAWPSFLQFFLNIQSNDFLAGTEIAIIGHFDFNDIHVLIDRNAQGQEEKLAAYRHAVNTIDEEVEGLVKQIVLNNKIPVVIGGGHNNAYPLLKGAAKAFHESQKIPIPQINCINLDAHTDYRPSEGRHSGNAFRYAEEDGFLHKYCVVGIHENYLPQNVWVDLVNNPFMDCITFEDIFIHEKQTFRKAVSHAIRFTEDNFTGIELDLDSVENILTSAATPSGIQPIHARQYVNLCAAHVNAGYLHICEGATRLSNGATNDSTGKLISYLVSDYIKMHAHKQKDV